MPRSLTLDKRGGLVIPEAALQVAGDDLMAYYGWKVIPQPVNLQCHECGAVVPIPGAQKSQPDRLAIRPYLHARDKHPCMNVYIEYKTRGKKPTRDQAAFHDALRIQGYTVLLIDRIEDLADWLGVKLDR